MRRLKRLPQNTPIRLPNVEITKEVKPMMTIGERIEVKDKRHDSLEKAEEECHNKKSAPANATHDNSACYGNCETVHSKTDGKEPYF